MSRKSPSGPHLVVICPFGSTLFSARLLFFLLFLCGTSLFSGAAAALSAEARSGGAPYRELYNSRLPSRATQPNYAKSSESRRHFDVNSRVPNHAPYQADYPPHATAHSPPADQTHDDTASYPADQPLNSAPYHADDPRGPAPNHARQSLNTASNHANSHDCDQLKSICKLNRRKIHNLELKCEKIESKVEGKESHIVCLIYCTVFATLLSLFTPSSLLTLLPARPRCMYTWTGRSVL